MSFRKFSLILGKLPVLIDQFNAKGNYLIHFISHFHADHYSGLKDCLEKKKKMIIYCSEITRDLLISNYKKQVDGYNDNAPKRTKTFLKFQILEEGSKISVPFKNEISHDVGSFEVSSFASNHCPGSLMFLFEHMPSFGHVFYSGDFRFENLSRLRLPPARCVLNELILDVTFLHNQFEDLPTRKEACDKLIEFIKKKHVLPVTKGLARNKANCRQIYLIVDLIGHEYALSRIHRDLGMRIIVNEKLLLNGRFKELEILAKNNLSLSESLLFLHSNMSYLDRYRKKSFIHLISFLRAKQYIGSETYKNAKKRDPNNCPLFIKLSTLWCHKYSNDHEIPSIEFMCCKEPKVKEVNGIYCICYSTHSSWLEFILFLKKLQKLGYIGKDIGRFLKFRTKKLCDVFSPETSNWKEKDLVLNGFRKFSMNHGQVRTIDNFDFTENKYLIYDHFNNGEKYEKEVYGKYELAFKDYDPIEEEEEEEVEEKEKEKENIENKKRKREEGVKNYGYIKYSAARKKRKIE